MKKVLLFISMLLAAVLITGLYSCTQDGGENDSRHRRGENNLENEEDWEVICKRVDEVTKVAGELLLPCNSPIEAEENLDEIRRLEAVDEVWTDEQTVFVKIHDFGTIPYVFPLKELVVSNANYDNIRQMVQSRASEYERNPYLNLDLKKICIVNQTYSDEKRISERNIVNLTKILLNRAGFDDVTVNNNPSVNFFRNDIFDYDIVFVITHGSYIDGHHWLFTSEEQSSDSFDFLDKIRNWWYDYSKDEISVGCVKETHNGKEKWMYFTKVSEVFVAHSSKKFSQFGNAIIINTACKSLMGENGIDYSLADAFIEKGLGCYLGYDKSDNAGALAGLNFLGRLISGMSIKQAYLDLPQILVKNDMQETDDNGKIIKEWTAYLQCYSSGFDQFSCINHPQLIAFANDNSGSIDDKSLKATQFLYDPTKGGSALDLIYYDYYYEVDSSPYRYGFYLSKTKDIKDAHKLNELEIGESGCQYDGDFVSFEAPLKNEDLEPETTYYYWAYFYDGFNYCLSERGEFTTPKQERIEQVIPKEILETMEPYITIYEGDSPPVVEGVYVISPNVISYDSTNGFDAGDLFADHYLKFSNQDILKNTLDFEGKEVVDGRTISYEGGPGAFISGTGDNFTVFFDVSGTAYFDEYNVDYTEALVISGTLTSTGIKNAEYSFVLTWKGDDPKPYAIKKGDFRVFKDNDGLASKATWPSGARRWGWDYHVKDGKITTPWSIYAVRK